MRICTMNRLLFICLVGVALSALAGLHPAHVAAAPLPQTSCTLPATVTTATQLSACITAANANGAGLDTITLGANITLSAALPQITTAIKLEGADHFIDGGNTMRIFSVASTGNFTINQATLKNGHAVDGGGISNAGFLIISESTLTGNSASAAGGAIYNGSGALLAVASSTISGNSAVSGGGISSAGTTLLFNSTISGNDAGGAGGGIALTSPSVLTASGTTFYGNTASAGGNQAAIFANSGTTVHLAGNLFAGGGNCDIRGTFNDKGYNLSDDATCTNGATGSATNATLNLGALADNGGPTLTHLPGAGSAAIGAIPNGTAINNNTLPMSCNNTTTDQPGSSRPLSAGIHCTSGAVEVAPTVTSLTIIKDASPAIGTDFDFTINSAPLTSYSDTTIGKPFWTRPNEGTTCTLSANSVRYHVQAFVVDTSGNYTIVSAQNYNGYLHLYQDSFDPLDQCANYLHGDDNSGLGSNQSELSYSLEAGRVYYLITSGFASASTGTFTNNIARDGGGGKAYTLYESFTLDDAVPDDSDSVNASITYAVSPGTYSVSELLADSAWGLDSATCTGASGGFSLTDETLAVAVASGETVACTFTNVTTVDCGNIMSESDLSFCIAGANTNGAGLDTLTLGADINLTTALPQITSEITLEGAGYAIDGANSVRIFYVAASGDFTVHQTTVQRGRADYGAGIYNAGTLTVTDSTFSGNRANLGGGGIFSLDTLRVTNSTFSGNSVTELVKSGGGISNNNGELTVTNSTFSNNRAYSGGGISNNNGELTVTNSTFSGNSADTGGGIFNDGTLTMSSSTFFGNSSDDRDRGGGILNADTAYLAGNVFAAGLNGANCVNSGGTLTDNGYNLSDDASCGFSGTSANNATLNLSALSVTTTPGQQVHTPQVGSDAIGVIPNGTTINNNGVTLACNQTTTDQLGADRPINGDANCTSGAVEVTPICPSWTVTTAVELSDCINLANANESPSPTADTITLGANITLTTALPQITSAITLEGAGYALDGGNSVQIFRVASTGDLSVNQATLRNGNESGNVPYGGAISSQSGTVTVTNSTISGSTGSFGGGIYNGIGTLTVSNSTISGNSADYGGGIYYGTGSLTVSNSTISGNTATTAAGGIFIYSGPATLTHNTFSGNDDGPVSDIFNDHGTVHLIGNIFAGTSEGNCENFAGTIYDNGYNLSADTTCANGGIGSLNNATLNLGTLADNGGPTQTHLPGAGSDAIGAIPYGTTVNNNGVTLACNQTTTDQLGVDRPITALTACTAGTVEVALSPICPSWTVTTAAELYDCITLANNNENPSPTADTITLGADIDLTTLTASPLPQITTEIMLEGDGYTIDGGDSMRIFYVDSGGEFSVSNATLQNGSATNGGGIYNDGTLTVTDSTFSGNTAEYGGIYNDTGTLIVTDSTFSDNTVSYGGGIYNWRGAVMVTNNTFFSNTTRYGGGIFNHNALLTVTNSAFTSNTATSYGGGIYNIGTLTVTNSAFSSNWTLGGGGIYNTGTLTVANSAFSSNWTDVDGGGGIHNYTGRLTVTNSTFSGNRASREGGGGIYNRSMLMLTNSTFSGNLADSGGDGIYNSGTTYLAGTIFANSASGDNCTNNSGTLTDNGYNLSDDASCGFSGTGSANNATLNLGALADNGGPTQTHLPSVGSDAIGAIPNGTTISNNGTTWTCDQSATDQRGESRPINSGDACTAGAVEVAPICTSWTVTTAAELSECITLANNNESPSPTADTITLGADITLSTALPQIASAITLEGAGYAIDGDNSVRIFYVNSGGDFTVNQATLQNGSANNGGGIYNIGGTVTVTDSTVSGNNAIWGGGIYNNGGTLTVTDSTFSGNSAVGLGGGIYNEIGAATVTNSTFSGNEAYFGGGIFNGGGGVLTVTSSTISDNSADVGGGLYNESTTHLAGSIFAAGPSGDNCTNIGTLTDNGYNLSDDVSCGFSGTGSANNATLNLGALADNGGPTQTHLPGAGSDAIGAIPNGTTISNNGTDWTCDQSATDQRGELRPLNSGGACTAGAVEVAAAIAVVGDVNCDDTVTIADALIILQYDVGLRTDSGGCPLGDSATELNAANGDVNGDGLTTISDALLILQCDVGMTNAFCPVTAVVVSDALPTADESALAEEAAEEDQAMSHQLFLPLVTR